MNEEGVDESLSIQEVVDTCPSEFLNKRRVLVDVDRYAEWFLVEGTVSAPYRPLTQIVPPFPLYKTQRGRRFIPRVCKVFKRGRTPSEHEEFIESLKRCMSDELGPICVRVSCDDDFVRLTKAGMLYNNPPTRRGYYHMMLAVLWGTVDGMDVLKCQDSQGEIVNVNGELVSVGGYVHVAMSIVNLFMLIRV
ncbi:unnamed protein product [Microthlaspi erraticum]|uniref:Uncharacterized protein n=1 Tax=Microthlaspi erraticum TaxID=1685480 RepID=A0A6D2KYH1_9BRAS|nr:unnamed protein product [Microthlaspi erraticum]